VPIIARCKEHSDWKELVSLGASHVFPELLESSLLISRLVLELLQTNEQELEMQMDSYQN